MTPKPRKPRKPTVDERAAVVVTSRELRRAASWSTGLTALLGAALVVCAATTTSTAAQSWHALTALTDTARPRPAALWREMQRRPDPQDWTPQQARRWSPRNAGELWQKKAVQCAKNPACPGSVRMVWAKWYRHLGGIDTTRRAADWSGGAALFLAPFALFARREVATWELWEAEFTRQNAET